MPSCLARILTLALLVPVAACADDGFVYFDAGVGTDAAPDGTPSDASAELDPSDVLFADDHVLEITIEMDPADFAALRAQPERIGLPKVTCDDQPAEEPYSYFPADITIDGTTFSNVGLRKKGGFGSLSETRPGFKVKPGEYVDQEIFGLSRLTLNNNVQDPTLISQCLGYALFRQAGVPASRCSFAHVTVNGEDLGIYSNVESLRKDFLRRHFADEDGRLYESGGEFLPGRTGSFQPKTNSDAPDCSDLDALASAAQAPDAELVSSLGAVLDLDAFITYWAMEVLLDHWDGYANNQNNYFFYHDPTSDQFHFIPWGIDALFTGRERSTRPSSVFACGNLAWRLYDLPETRARYTARLAELLDTVWDEPALLAEVSRMQTLLEPFADPEGSGALASAIDGTRDFIGARRAVLMAELEGGPPEWPYPLDESCRIVVGDVSATFETTWGSLEDFTAGSGTMGGNVSGVPLASDRVSATSGLSEEGKPLIQLFALLPDGRYAVVFLFVQDPANWSTGTRAIDLANVAAIMTFYDPADDSTSGGGIVLSGSFTLSEAGQSPGHPVVGTLTGQVYEL